jgi:nitroreductase
VCQKGRHEIIEKIGGNDHLLVPPEPFIRGVYLNTYLLQNHIKPSFGLKMSSKAGSNVVPMIVAAIAGGAITFVGLKYQRRHKEEKGYDKYNECNNKTTVESIMNMFSPESILDLIRTRRSIFPKQFNGGAVPSSIIQDMIEAARWAPTHKITQPWRFLVFESYESRVQLGQFLALMYKKEQEANGKEVITSKYEKKITSAKTSSHVIALVVDAGKKNPFVEEIASVASAAQNMQLLATSHGVGAYWSTGCIYDKHETLAFQDGVGIAKFHADVQSFLNLQPGHFCIGWMFVGSLDKNMKWPSGSRAEMNDHKVVWR